MARMKRRTLNNHKVEHEANTEKTIDVPTDALVNGARLRATLDYDTGTGGAVAEDGILELIEKIQIVVDGEPIRTIFPKRYWYTLLADYGVMPEFDDITATNAAGKTAQVDIPIPFRLNIANPRDLRACLPAKHLNNVEVVIRWNAAADLGSDHTINSSDTEAELRIDEHYLSAKEEREGIGTGRAFSGFGVSGEAILDGNTSGLTVIKQSEIQRTFDAAYGDFQLKQDLPAGSHILAMLDMFVYDDDSRDDGVVNEYRIKQHSPVERSFARHPFVSAQADDLLDGQVDDPIEGQRVLTGYVREDLTRYKYPGAPNPFNMGNVSKGDIKVEMKTDAPTNSNGDVYFQTTRLTSTDYRD